MHHYWLTFNGNLWWFIRATFAWHLNAANVINWSLQQATMPSVLCRWIWSFHWNQYENKSHHNEDINGRWRWNAAPIYLSDARFSEVNSFTLCNGNCIRHVRFKSVAAIFTWIVSLRLLFWCCCFVAFWIPRIQFIAFRHKYCGWACVFSPAIGAMAMTSTLNSYRFKRIDHIICHESTKKEALLIIRKSLKRWCLIFSCHFTDSMHFDFTVQLMSYF